MSSYLRTRFQKAIDFIFIDNSSIILSCFLLAFVGVVIYRNTFSVPFLFDDMTQIVFNTKIQTLNWPWPCLANTRRPFLYTTLAFNFHYDKLNTFGYHVFNIRIHILAAMSLFLLIYKTCRLPRIGDRFQKNAVFLALGASMLWLSHPLQTQAVTYIIQRAESLMSLLFILSIYFSANYLTSRNIAWLIMAGIFSILCGLTKEVALVLPIVILFYDRTFLSCSIREAYKKNYWLYLSLSLTWIIMFLLFFTTQPETIPTAGFGIKGMTSWDYVINQPKVIMHYLYLAIWPKSLIFDYHWPVVQDISKILPSIGIIMACFIALIASYGRHPILSFLGLSFLIILAPSSSFIPLKDLIYEYRMYLPLSCLAILFTVLLKCLFWKFAIRKYRNKCFILTIACLVLILGILTDQRNKVYANEELLWKDVLKNQPDNVRIWNDLGSYLFNLERYQEAQICFLKSLSLNSTSAEISANVAMALMAQRKFDQAIPYAQKAIDLSENFAVGHYNLGLLYFRMGRDQEAISHFEKAIKLGLVTPQVLKNLGYALSNSGQFTKAILILENAQRLDPQSKSIQAALNNVLRKQRNRTRTF